MALEISKRNLLRLLLVQGDLALANQGLQLVLPRCRLAISTHISLTSSLRLDLYDGQVTVNMHPLAFQAPLDFVISRLIDCLPLFHAAAGLVTLAGQLDLDMSDAGSPDCVSFSQRREGPMIPDSQFLSSNAYADQREVLLGSGPLATRSSAMFWTGSSTGFRTEGWRSLPRVKLCQITRAAPEPQSFDCGLTRVVQEDFEGEREEIEAEGLLVGEVPASEFGQHAVHVDIDGNTNFWPGLFLKLLSGGVVMKIASAEDFRQWYYHKLRPWVNFIPVEKDMSDLLEKQAWLTHHPENAQMISRSGQDLAASMTLASECWEAIGVFEAALRS